MTNLDGDAFSVDAGKSVAVIDATDFFGQRLPKSGAEEDEDDDDDEITDQQQETHQFDSSVTTTIDVTQGATLRLR